MDDFAQGGQGEIDVSQLEHMLGLHLFVFIDLFGASKVPKVEFGTLEHAFGVDLVGLDEDLEEGVGPRGLDVHLGRSLYTVFLTSGQKDKAIGFILDDVFRETFHVDTLELVFTDL